MKLSLGFGQRLLLLFLLFVVGIILTSALQSLLSSLTDNITAVERITMVAQDMLAFVLPALIIAMLITRLPADFLRLRSVPSWRMLGAALIVTIAIQPTIESINSLCAQLPWPDSVLELEQISEATVLNLIGPHNSTNFILSLLIMAALTGLAEELFFRGAMQRLLESRPMSVHVAIWIAAFIFAAMHAQPVGLLPRTLLGALFGYVTVWSGSLWTAVACHALNNALALITLWAGIDTVSTPATVIGSAALTAAGIYLMLRQSRSRSSAM